MTRYARFHRIHISNCDVFRSVGCERDEPGKTSVLERYVPAPVNVSRARDILTPCGNDNGRRAKEAVCLDPWTTTVTTINLNRPV